MGETKVRESSNSKGGAKPKWSLEKRRYYGRALLVVCPKCGQLGRLYFNRRIGWYVKHKSNQTHSVREDEALEIPLHEGRINLITYMGGDSYLLPYLAKMTPPHETYVEVFGGGGVFLLNKPPSKVEVYNDLDGNLVNLFKVVKERPEEFQQQFEMILYSRQVYYEFLKKHKGGGWSDDMERAVGWFFLTRGAYLGKIGAGFATGKSRNVAKSFFNAVENVKKIHRRLRNVIIESLDFREVIKRYDGSRTFFYCDPPHLYLSTDGGAIGAKYYNMDINAFNDADYMGLLKLLENIKGKFLLKQAVDVPYLRDWANENGFSVLRLKLKKSTRGDPRGKESDAYHLWFIANYKLKGKK